MLRTLTSVCVRKSSGHVSARESGVASKHRGPGGRAPMRLRPLSIDTPEWTGGANICGTSFVGRFVLDHHPVPDVGWGERGRWAQVACATAARGSQSTSALRAARALRPC